MKQLKYFFLILLIYFCNKTQSQVIKGVFKDGDFNGKSHVSFQDSRGYLWIGTSDGLYRWDSKKFIHYTVADGLPNNEVLGIFEDSKNRIWLSTFSDQLSYIYNDKIYNSKNDKRLSGIKVNYGINFFEYKGVLYFGEKALPRNGSLETFNLKINELVADSNLKLSSLNYSFDFFYKFNDSVFVFLLDSSSKISYKINLFQSNKHTQFKTVDSLNSIYQILPFRKGLVYNDYNKGKAFTYNEKFLLTDSFAIISGKSYLLCNYKNCYFLFDSNSVFTYKNGVKTIYAKIQDEITGHYDQNSIQFINTLTNIYYKDVKQLFYFRNLSSISSNKLFFLGKKIVFLSPKNELFDFDKKYTHKEYTISHLNSSIYNTYAQKDSIIVTTSKNIYYYTSLKNETVGILLPNKLKSYFIEDILGVAKANEICYSNFNFKYSSVYKNKILFASSQGLFIQDKDYYRQIYTQRTNNFFIDSKNRIWFSTMSGNYIATTFYPKVSNEKLINFNSDIEVRINDCKEDKNGNVLLATNNGLYIFSLDLKQYHIDNKTILSGNECSKIFLDTDNTLWIATNEGLSHIRYFIKKGNNDTMRFERINSFSKTDGLGTSFINDFAINGDSLYIATEKGLTLVSDKNYTPDTIKIPVYLNDFYVNSKKINIDITNTFRFDENNIEIDFSAIYYNRTERLKIYYQLIKDCDTTINIPQGDKIIFQSLAYGDYTIIIKAMDADYPYINGQSKPISWTISPPFYKTWFFIGFIFFLGLAIMGVIMYLQFRQRAERITFEKELARLKLEALKAEMNPHFIFNCLNGIKDFMIQRDFEQSQHYLSVLSKLIRLALYNTKEDFVTLENEIKFIDMYVEMEQMRFSNRFEYIKETNGFDSFHIQVPTMLLQPFFENAIRHGRIGKLKYYGRLFFKILEDDNQIIIWIKDNGIGLPKAKEIKEQIETEHKSMAMDIINERIVYYRKSYNLAINIEINDLSDSINAADDYKTEIKLTFDKESL